MMKVDKEKVVALAIDISEAIEKHLDKTPMKAGEIQLALTQVIWRVGQTACEVGEEKALREKALP